MDTKFILIQAGKLSAEEIFDFFLGIGGILGVADELYSEVMVGFLHITELGDTGDAIWDFAQLQYRGIFTVLVFDGIV